MSKDVVLGETGVGDVIVEAVAKRIMAESLRAAARIRDQQGTIANEATREAVVYTTNGVGCLGQLGNKAGGVLAAVCDVQRITHKRVLRRDLQNIGVDEVTADEVVDDLR